MELPSLTVPMLLDSMVDAAILTDAGFHVTSWNPAAEALYGYSREEAVGRAIQTLLETAFQEGDGAQAAQTLLETGRWTGEVTQRRKDGARVAVQAAVTLLRDATGTPAAVLAINRDVRAGREAALARMAGCVAHDFNNLLAAIGGFAELADGALAEDHPARRHLQRVLRTTERATHLTAQLQLVGHGRPRNLEILNLSNFLTEADPLVRQVLGPGVSVQRPRASAGAGEVYVEADRGLLDQLVLNLVGHARDAMRGQGTLTQRLFRRSRSSRGPLCSGKGDCVELEISDTGPGIAPEVLPHVFEPYFTTRPGVQGGGLGLAVVAEVVRQSGGQIEVSSSSGGTVFRMHFPAAAGERRALHPVPRPVLHIPRTGTVLVVDDDGAVREVLASMLRRLGYVPVQAEDGVEALELFDREPGAFVAVVTDVRMPRMGGLELAVALRRRRLSVPIVFVSGFAGEPGDALPDAFVGERFVQKPLRMADLAGALDLRGATDARLATAV